MEVWLTIKLISKEVKLPQIRYMLQQWLQRWTTEGLVSSISNCYEVVTGGRLADDMGT